MVTITTEYFKLNDYERGYLPAVIDAEGCIGLYKHTRRNEYGKGYTWESIVVIDNTRTEILEVIKEICRDEGTIGTVSAPHCLKGKCDYYRIPVEIQRIILPQLHFAIKERQKDLLLEALIYLDIHKWSTRSPYEKRLLEIEKLLKEEKRNYV